MAAYDAAATREALEGAGFSVVEDGSAVTGSPYRYLYVFLTERRFEGAHVIVSDMREWGHADGWLVGGSGGDDPATYREPEEFETLEEALDGVQGFSEELS